jgi:2'-5' RNA ligase
MVAESMKNRYNLALVPLNKHDDLRAFAKNFYAIALNYRMGETSIPHITLCQFIADENDLGAIWADASRIQESKVLRIRLNEVRCLASPGFNAVSLMPDNEEALTTLHYAIANLVEERRSKCFAEYDPHLTVINTEKPEFENYVSGIAYETIEDDFNLVLGLSDDLGQLKSIIYKVS